MTDILDGIEGRRVLVVGLARSGRAAARLLLKEGARVTGTDRLDSIEDIDSLERAGMRLRLGGDRVELVSESDLVVLSPGVPLDAPIPAEARRRRVPLIGELELAGRILERESALALVAVTGTNGKSTTAALCAHLFAGAGRKVFLGGNIGRPLAELLLSAERVDLAVVEVSSFQLEHLSDPCAFVPRVGVWLNLTPDHLDRHRSMQIYGGMKRRLFEGQGAGDVGVFFLDDPELGDRIGDLACRRTGFSRDPDEVPAGGVWIERRRLHMGEIVLQLNSERLAGDHNAENAAAAVVAASAMGIDPRTIQAGLDSYPGLPHRLEPVRQLDGVRYVNDSKGTNVDATAKSLTSFAAPVILLAGGRGKGTGYAKLRPLVSERVRQLIVFGEEADRLARDLDGCAPARRVSGLAQAVQTARELAHPGDVVLLSPACSSFDMFTDYAQRGRLFCEMVRGLKERS